MSSLIHRDLMWALLSFKVQEILSYMSSLSTTTNKIGWRKRRRNRVVARYPAGADDTVDSQSGLDQRHAEGGLSDLGEYRILPSPLVEAAE